MGSMTSDEESGSEREVGHYYSVSGKEKYADAYE